MKLGTTALTSIVVAALALGTTALVILTRGQATSGEAEQRKKNLLPIWREEDVNRVELRAGGVVLERGQGDGGEPVWRITAPLKEPADPDAVERLLAALGFAAPL